MTPIRGTALLCEHAELHEASLVSLVDVAEMVMTDGLMTPDECRLLMVHVRELPVTWAPLPGRIACADDAMRVIGAAAHAGAMTPWVGRVAREAAADAEMILAEAA